MVTTMTMCQVKPSSLAVIILTFGSSVVHSSDKGLKEWSAFINENYLETAGRVRLRWEDLKNYPSRRKSPRDMAQDIFQPNYNLINQYLCGYKYDHDAHKNVVRGIFDWIDELEKESIQSNTEKIKNIEMTIEGQAMCIAYIGMMIAEHQKLLAKAGYTEWSRCGCGLAYAHGTSDSKWGKGSHMSYCCQQQWHDADKTRNKQFFKYSGESLKTRTPEQRSEWVDKLRELYRKNRDIRYKAFKLLHEGLFDDVSEMCENPNAESVSDVLDEKEPVENPNSVYNYDSQSPLARISAEEEKFCRKIDPKSIPKSRTTPSLSQRLTQRLTDLQNVIEVLDPEAEDYVTRYNDLSDEINALRKDLGIN